MSQDAAATGDRLWPLALILGLFLLLAALYGVTTPISEGPDELEHALGAMAISGE